MKRRGRHQPRRYRTNSVQPHGARPIRPFDILFQEFDQQFPHALARERQRRFVRPDDAAGQIERRLDQHGRSEFSETGHVTEVKNCAGCARANRRKLARDIGGFGSNVQRKAGFSKGTIDHDPSGIRIIEVPF
jgi:hypothetical protein